MAEVKTEVTTRFARGGLEDLTAAWAFIMEHIDKVGGDPTIEISPVWSADYDDIGVRPDAPWVRTFSAVVSGMTEVEPEAGDRP